MVSVGWFLGLGWCLHKPSVVSFQMSKIGFQRENRLEFWDKKSAPRPRVVSGYHIERWHDVPNQNGKRNIWLTVDVAENEGWTSEALDSMLFLLSLYMFADFPSLLWVSCHGGASSPALMWTPWRPCVVRRWELYLPSLPCKAPRAQI